MVEAVFAVDACRTAIGRVKGSLAGERPDHLTATVIEGLLRRTPSLPPDAIDDVYWGASNQAGEDNRNVARMGVLLAGLPVTVPGATVNRLCGSGMEAIAVAARAIASGEIGVCLAGGTESMTRAPFVMPRAESPFPRNVEVVDTRLGWRLVSPRMEAAYPPVTLGQTAENVAQRYYISREAQDQLALRSHRLAAAAQREARFRDEIIPVNTGGVDFLHDELVKPDLTIEDLAARPPAFLSGGSVTGGNSSPLSDGAAGLILMSERAVAALGVDPLARYLGTATAGVHPDYMGIGPVSAVTALLKRIGSSIEDIDLLEVNEAFAAQAVAVINELKANPERVNVNGGAIALGHPIAGSGARITATALHQLRRQGGDLALISMCIGVGQGIATLWAKP